MWNVECGIFEDVGVLNNYSDIFGVMWRAGRELTPSLLREYAAKFEARNSRTKAHDLVYLGVTDNARQVRTSPSQLRKQSAPAASQRAIGTEVATVAWTGLQSFTGEYQFQIEYPRAAGEVVQKLAGNPRTGKQIAVECDDGTISEHVLKSMTGD